VGVSGVAPTGTDVGHVLYESAAKATLAPSILNTQPWRWRVHRDRLDLYGDRERQVLSIDRDGRLLTLSCGGALHHACVVLLARGLSPDVHRFPDPADADLLARVSVAAHDVGQADIARAASIARRHSDRRLIAATYLVSQDIIDRLHHAADGFGVRLHRVTGEQRLILALAAATAREAQKYDVAYQRDLIAWTDDRPTGEGVPVDTLVADVARPVPLRDFAGGGETGLHAGLGDDEFADFLILATSHDRPSDWLRAGEAMSAVWLTATEHTVAASVLSDVIEVPGARAMVENLLPGRGYPQLVLRIGVAAHSTPPPASPRRRPETVIEVNDRL
jgi:nitroreductase